MGWIEVFGGRLSATAARGRFITLEGGEGVGKSTQAVALAEALRARGVPVVVTREPGGTPGAEAIRALLMTGPGDRWSAPTEALLFAAARADHVERVIRPALERGEWVICDRFIDSTRAYQGGAGGVVDADILDLHRVGAGGLMPDRTLLMTLPRDAAERRTKARDGDIIDRFAGRDTGYHDRLESAFAMLADQECDRIKMVSAAGTPAAVTAALIAACDDLL